MSLISQEKIYALGFSLVPGIGRAKTAQLERHFGSLEQAWHTSAGSLGNCGLDNSSVEAIIHHRSRINLKDEISRLDKLQISFFSHHDPEYPSLLKQIYDLPPVIFVKGWLTPEDNSGISVIGSRVPTAYGRQITQELTNQLVDNGITVISGLAQGIDSIAHRVAVEAGERTIAVCATGLDITYPPSNHSLAGQITDHGALISEYSPGTRPRPEYFPRRNRIMSGISLGVLVTEARENSGALITAKLALEYNREVFSVPGPVYSANSRGCNWLIQQGAKLVTEAGDILEEMKLPLINTQKRFSGIIEADEFESAIIRALKPEPLHIDAIVRSSGLTVAQVSSTLTIMEIKGWVRQTDTMTYTLSLES